MTAKKNILITAGPTIEPLDPIRYLTNHSSGKMGYALAKACLRAGHSVTLISGPTNLSKPARCQLVSVKTTKEMLKAVLKYFRAADIIFKVAAVADYRVAKPSKQKIKKTDDVLKLELVKNPDILKHLGQIKKKSQLLVGFAAETHKGVSYARKKLKDKNLDWIALNVISGKNVGFQSDNNEVTLISSDGKKIVIPRQSKNAIAKIILNTVLKVEVDVQNRFDFTRFNPISLIELIRKKYL